jgi:hypothetical protein
LVASLVCSKTRFWFVPLSLSPITREEEEEEEEANDTFLC